ncbi:hypothetical protein Tco_0380952 [Tanacetum coccineum]
MLRAFPMSLSGAASYWLRNKPSGSIITWEDLKTKFLSKYCPPDCTAKKMEEINNFQQEPYENLYQAWERFKELLMKCPRHYLTEIQEVVLFYNGLDVPTREILDSTGAIPSKTAANAKVAIQKMVEYSQKWPNGTSRTRSTETSDGLSAIQAQLSNLGREIKKVNENVYATQVGCEQCKGGGYRATDPGFYQRNNANPSYQERRQSMEDTLSKFISERGFQPKRLAQLSWPPRVSLGRLLPHARGLRFESLRRGFPSRWESVGFCTIDASIRGWQGLPSGYLL